MEAHLEFGSGSEEHAYTIALLAPIDDPCHMLSSWLYNSTSGAHIIEFSRDPDWACTSK
jgi:hypothetical protein